MGTVLSNCVRVCACLSEEFSATPDWHQNYANYIEDRQKKYATRHAPNAYMNKQFGTFTRCTFFSHSFGLCIVEIAQHFISNGVENTTATPCRQLVYD